MRKSFILLIFLLIVPSTAQASTLQSGSSGAAVRTLQRGLAAHHFMTWGQVTGHYGERTWHAVMAFQKWSGIERDGVAGPQTQRTLARAGQPRPQGRGAANRLEIWRARQILAVINGGKIRRLISISSGRPGYATPLGRYRVYSKIVDEWSHKYNAPMPYASYFTGGIALHGSADVPGYPASHGCVRVPYIWMRDVYNAAPMGRQVLVLDR